MLLEANNLSGGYGSTFTLDSINLELREGNIIGLIGPNGSGKSTLLRVLAGQLRYKGELAWLQRRIWQKRELAKVLAYVPQFPTFDESQRVVDVLRIGRIPHLGLFGFETAADVKAVAETAELLDLTPLLDRPMDELSGGQRQRAFIARALVAEPRMILLDEPTSALDLRYQAELSRLLRRLATEKSLSIVMACHDLNLAGDLCDELLLLDGGRPAASGPTATVLDPAVLSPVFGVEMTRRPGIAAVAK